MKNTFLETSAVNRAVAVGLDPAALRDCLTESGRCPVVGIHVIYELAATFLRQERADIVRLSSGSYTTSTPLSRRLRWISFFRKCCGSGQTPPRSPFCRTATRTPPVLRFTGWQRVRSTAPHGLSSARGKRKSDANTRTRPRPTSNTSGESAAHAGTLSPRSAASLTWPNTFATVGRT